MNIIERSIILYSITNTDNIEIGKINDVDNKNNISISINNGDHMYTSIKRIREILDDAEKLLELKEILK